MEDKIHTKFFIFDYEENKVTKRQPCHAWRAD